MRRCLLRSHAIHDMAGVEMLPPELAEPQYDAVIIYSNHESDVQLAVKVQEYIHTFVPELEDNAKPKVCVFDSDDMLHIMNRFKQLEEAVNRSTFMIILITDNLDTDAWGTTQKELCIQESIDNKKKQDCVIPLLACDKVPFGLKRLKPWHAKNMLQKSNITDIKHLHSATPNPKFVAKVQKLFNFRLQMKLGRQQVQQAEISEWRLEQQRQNFQALLLADGIDAAGYGPVEHDETQLQNPTNNAVDSNTYQRGPKLLTGAELKTISRESTELGRGGFGKVYKGKWLSKHVAIKVMHTETTWYSQLERQCSKEKAVSFLRHPYVLPMLAYTDQQPIPSILLFPYKKGGDLARLLNNSHNLPPGCSTWKDLVRICYQIVKGLAFLHNPTRGRMPIRHGDIKPANILLDEQYNACIGDTGLAVELPRDEVTATNVCDGTATYRDPLIAKSGKKTTTNDIYSFGILLLQVLLLEVGDKYSEILSEWDTAGGWTPDKMRLAMRADVWCQTPPYEKNIATLIDTVFDCKRSSNRVTIDQLLEIFTKLITAGNILKYNWNETNLCVMCHFYPSADLKCCKCATSRFCLGCLALSYLNPPFCPDCGLCSPPIGGDNYYALLIAGSCTDDKEETFINDVRRVFNCLSDPRVSGMREENIICMFPKEDLCKDATYVSTERNVINKLKELKTKFEKYKDPPTLIVYISCHGKKQTKNNATTLVWALDFNSRTDSCQENNSKLALDNSKTVSDTAEINNSKQASENSELASDISTLALDNGQAVLNTDELAFHNSVPASDNRQLDSDISKSTRDTGGLEADTRELTSDILRTKLQELDFGTLLCILDCCYAGTHMLPFGDDPKVQNKRLFQWASCDSNDTSGCKKTGSHFTLCLIAGLTTSAKCPNDPFTTNTCSYCEKLREQTKHKRCVMFDDLREYVVNHFKARRYTGQTPRFITDTDSTLLQLAYFNPNPLSTKVWFTTQDGSREMLMLDHTLAEFSASNLRIDLLKQDIYKRVKELNLLGNESYTRKEFSDLVCISFITHKGIMQEITGNDQKAFNKVKELHDRSDMIYCVWKKQLYESNETIVKRP